MSEKSKEFMARFEFKMKNSYFKMQIHTLNLWILRQRLSMTRILSLREFAKCERANLWQSKGKFAFKFMKCHARFARSQWRTKKTHFIILWWRRILSFWAFAESEKSTLYICKFTLWICGYFAIAQYDNATVFFECFAKGSVWQNLKFYLEFA